MQQVYPALRITDYDRSKAFYVDGLGFSIDWEHRYEPHFPVFMQVSREGLSLYLSQHSGDCQVGGLAYLYVPDVDAWHRAIVARGLTVDPPENQPWGSRDMCLTDPDGNQLRISTRLAA
jgi:catechol 2,3-dioxygenase-like lactoylglutathione lyase family enzyme